MVLEWSIGCYQPINMTLKFMDSISMNNQQNSINFSRDKVNTLLELQILGLTLQLLQCARGLLDLEEALSCKQGMSRLHQDGENPAAGRGLLKQLFQLP